MNDKLREMLIRHEGYRKIPYADVKGIKTVGVGHNLVANPLNSAMAEYLQEHGELTDEMISDLLEDDVEVAQIGCRKLYPKFDDFSENRQNALTDWVFNVGLGTARSFHQTNLCINLGNWQGAADHLIDSEYARQVHKRAFEISDLIRNG
jgi:lysozyme